MENNCTSITIRGEVYLLSGYDHKVGNWCLFYDSPSKVLEVQGESLQIKSRTIISEEDAEFINSIKAKKGEELVKAGDVSAMTHGFHGGSMMRIIATTDKELIEDGVPSINAEDVERLKENKDALVKFKSLVTGQCNCICHKPGMMVMHIMACCHPTYLEIPELNEDNSIKIETL